ncbi:unnamed protein product [Moneuplotes crassus]|uniref:Uncharacterized protein n=1 Tax=Euplotes crassus TaxID=5936 RepID=A0AAD1X6J2_EUPCR|nr:unnamed protein product [Moneuplotes crassus]
MNPRGAYQASYQQRNREKREREKLQQQNDKKMQQMLKSKFDMLQKLEEEDGELQFDPDVPEKVPTVRAQQPGIKKTNSLKGPIKRKNSSKKPTVANLRDKNSNSRQQDDRPAVVLTSGNGLGLWCHAKKEASVSMYNEGSSNSQLPPIQNKLNRPRKSANSQRRLTPKQKPVYNPEVDRRVETSMVQMLERKVTELSTELDRMEIEKQKMEYEYNIMKRDSDKLQYELDQFKQDNETLVEKSYLLDQRDRELQQVKHELSVIKEREQKFKQDYENEAQQRSQENAEHSFQINELQEQLQEYEDEHQNLINKIREMEAAHDDLNNREASASKISPEKSPMRPPKASKSPIMNKDLDNSPLNGTTKLNDREESEINSKIDPNDINEQKVRTPEQQIIELKKRLKRDADTRKKMQVVVQHKDENIRELKKEIESLNTQIKEEQSQRKRVSNSKSQKDNRITVLDNKLKEALTNEKQMKKKLKEYEQKIQELEEGKKKTPKKKEVKDTGPKLFGANEDALIDALYAPTIPLANNPQLRQNQGVDQFGHHDIPPARPKQEEEIVPVKKIQDSSIKGPLFGSSPDSFGYENIPPARHAANKDEEVKKVHFPENLNMHENSSASSLDDGEIQPVKAQPFLFGPGGQTDDLDEINFPTDGHLQKQINI